MDNDELVGRNVVRHRGTKSQAEVAKAMRDRGWKWSQGTLSTIETGERPLRLNEASDLADILGIPLSLLLRRDGDTEISARAREVSAAEKALQEAVEAYWDAQTNLALVGDDADVRDGLSVALLKSWLTKRPEEVIAELRTKHEAEGIAEEHQWGTVTIDRETNGKYLNLLNDNWGLDVEHQEEA